MKRRKYDRKDTQLCVWCDDRFETNHANAQTCSGKCRTNLARFRKLTGMDPDRPPGNVTAHTAYKDLVGMLLAAERRRRMGLAAMRQQEFTVARARAIRALEDDGPDRV